MEDLAPLLIFVIIVIVNIVKFFAGKGTSPSSSQGDQSKRAPSSIDTFYEEIAQKFAAKPTELPSWPENRERPDYLREMDVYEQDQPEETYAEKASVIEQMPELVARASAATVSIDPATTFKSSIKSVPNAFAGLKSIRIPTSPSMSSGKSGKANFSLNNKAAVRKAIIANLIFSPPRAFDVEFENTITK